MAVEITKIEWKPGDKWLCGELGITAETELGRIEIEEIIPGPRHSQDRADLKIQIAGKYLDPAIVSDSLPMDFGVPATGDGIAAKRFRASMKEDAAEVLTAWISNYKEYLKESSHDS